jgi:hypothetical protein
VTATKTFDSAGDGYPMLLASDYLGFKSQFITNNASKYLLMSVAAQLKL